MEQIEGSEHSGQLIVNYTQQFTPDGPFKTREELLEWARAVGKKNGLVIVVSKSDTGGNGRRGRVILACERHGTYKPPKKTSELVEIVDKKRKRRSGTGSKKCGCPFLLHGRDVQDGMWTLTVVCGTHNHDVAKFLQGHSYAGRLNESEQEILRQMTSANAQPRQILTTLKVRDLSNVSTLRTIYNAKQKQRLRDAGGRSQMQQLMHLLERHNYLEWHRRVDDVVVDILWAHPTSIQLFRCFPQVLVMDCTYKTNRFKYPVLDVVGETSTGMTFSVAFGYMAKEKEDNFAWALKKIKDMLDGQTLPKVIATDRDKALMDAIKEELPDSANLLCLWHINRNVLANIKPKFSEKEDFDIFYRKWMAVVYATSEAKYKKAITALELQYRHMDGVISYLRNTWLKDHAHQFVAAWTNNVMHFGCTTSNRAESAHAKLKKHLRSSQGNFVTVWTAIHSMLEGDHNEIKKSFEQSLIHVAYKHNITIFSQLRGFVSKFALEKILDELARAKGVGFDKERCGCVLRRTHGLPCAHEIAEYEQARLPIPISEVHQHWQKLSFELEKCERQKDFSIYDALGRVLEKYGKCDNDTSRAKIIQSLLEIAAPSTSLIVPPEKAKTRGRPQGAKNIDSSTKRDPSYFEHVLSTASTSSNPKPKGRPKKLAPRWPSFMNQLPMGWHKYIDRLIDVRADGNCGYRAVAHGLGMGESCWKQIRADMLEELKRRDGLYRELFAGDKRFNEIRTTLDCYESPADYSYWMTFPDMGFLVANTYNVVVVLLSEKACVTFLPMHSEAPTLPLRKKIGVGFVNNNHFVEVVFKENLQEEIPIPPIALEWKHYRHLRAEGWRSSYNFYNTYENVSGVAEEIVNLDDD